MLSSPATRILIVAAVALTLLPACGEESPVFMMSIAVAPISGDLPAYDRDEWRHWIDDDGDCQDTRQEALVAESVSVVEYTDSDQCRVASGEWIDPYTGERFADPSDLEIDHLVPLANAHASGGWAWSESRKRVYANDLLFAGHLVAVHGPANQAKGKSGPENWQPPASSYWCQYAIDWITVKNSWGLTATEAEVAALAEMLDTCEPRRILEGLESEARPTATATTAAVGDGAYATCYEAEDEGEQRLQGSEGDGWGFPQSVVPSARDGDSDGVVCEEAARGATPTPRPVAIPATEAPPTTTGTERVYGSCDEAEAAGEQRVQGTSGNGRGFPQSMVPSARDGDSDGVVCEETARGATPTPRPVAIPTTEAPPTATGAERVYDSCDEAEASGEQRVQGSSGTGSGFPQSMVPSARDGDSDGVVCEKPISSATPASGPDSEATHTPRPVATATLRTPSTATAAPTDAAHGAYASCEEAEAAGEQRVQGSSGTGRGFPQSMVPSARDGDSDGVVCEETARSATPTPEPVAIPATEAPPTATATEGVYASCDEAEAAGEERVQGSKGSGWGFPQSMVPSARDGDSDGVVCEETMRSATPTPGPVATPMTETPPTSTGTERVYGSCDEAEAAGEERVQGSKGSGWGFPQSMVPSARDGDSDGVVCEQTRRSATPTPEPVAIPTTEAPPTASATEGVYASCDEAEAAGEERVQGSKGSGWGFPQSMVPSARDGDSDGVVCEVTVRSATPTPEPVASPATEAPPTATATDRVYASCDDAEAAGEQRVQGSSRSGWGFPQSMVPSARDGDSDGVVCEQTARSAKPTPEPDASPTTEAPPTATATEGVYSSCDEAEAAGEDRVQGSSGNGRGFPQSMVPSARDGDSDGVVCER